MEILFMITVSIATGLFGYILRAWRELDDIKAHYDALLLLLEQGKVSMEFVRAADWALGQRLYSKSNGGAVGLHYPTNKRKR